MICVETIEQLQDAFVGALQESLPQVEVCGGYALRQYHPPLTAPMLSVAVQQVTAAPTAMEHYLGNALLNGERVQLHGYLAEATLALELFVPMGVDAKGQNRLFVEILNRLLPDSSFDIGQIQSHAPEFSEPWQCFVQHITVQTAFLVTRKQPASAVDQVILKATASEQ